MLTAALRTARVPLAALRIPVAETVTARCLHASALLEAGHSKWAKIARSKGANDQARGLLFSKLARAVGAAARAGGPDPNHNARLAAALEAAKRANCPRDIIERALKSKEGAVLHEAVYEATGPLGIAFIIETLTDNKNRTTSTLRSAFTKAGGELAATGAHGWIFKTQGRITAPLPALTDAGFAAAGDKLFEAAAGAGAGDVELPEENDEAEEGGAAAGSTATVWCDKDALSSVRTALEGAGITVAAAEVVRVPAHTVSVSGDAEETFLRLLEVLEGHEDVQRFDHNGIPE